jgi:protein-tyrosine phosphatase
LGNLIRSPLAAALTRERLAAVGLADRYHVTSAGVIAGNGHVSPAEAIRTATRHGLDLRPHLSTPLTRELLQSASLVIAVDRMVAECTLELVPDLGPRLRLLTQFDPALGTFDVPDPMGQPQEVYEEAYRLISAGVTGLIAALIPQAAPRRGASAEENEP